MATTQRPREGRCHLTFMRRPAVRWTGSAVSLRSLSLPGLRLEKLKGDRSGQHSIRVNDQYRVCFRWTEAGAEDVEIVDYH